MYKIIPNMWTTIMIVKVSQFFYKKGAANLLGDRESYLFSGFRTKICEKWFYAQFFILINTINILYFLFLGTSELLGTSERFEYLLSMVARFISKNGTRSRKCIFVAERLTLTLDSLPLEMRSKVFVSTFVYTVLHKIQISSYLFHQYFFHHLN